MIPIRISVLLLLSLSFCHAQMGLLGDIIKAGAKEAGKELVKDAIVGGVHAATSSGNSNGGGQPTSVIVQNDEATQAELRALRQEIELMRQQQSQAKSEEYKRQELAKLRAIADMTFDPFQPSTAHTALMPDL